MRRRLVLALGLLAVLVALAGCASPFGGGGPDDARLNQNATYEWDTNATTTYDVARGNFTGVIGVENQSYVQLYQRSELGTDEPLDVASLRFRYPDNGTVVAPANRSNFYVNATNSRLNVTLPAAGGQVAFTANRPNAKRFAIPMYLDSAHSVEVVLPPQARVGVPLLSKVSPGGSTSRVLEGSDRMLVRWQSADRGPIVTRYYLARDLLLFGGIGGILALVGVGGALYYLRQIRVLERRREEIGLDVETETDEFDDDDPPPGMR
ncbi:DUF5803 family protein [Halosimplex pelagicum]|uniref:Uncharacterized protein n=1 Tax=Halosimplex pelagicum TaxID=869886 RepID=A0A7D5P8P3_9EURY|nr:DUF5803 family protein [Halosimplex pelagicum]QLH83566.1 hypothetical protein HZS54_18870 [Halosimplex pelagicum]